MMSPAQESRQPAYDRGAVDRYLENVRSSLLPSHQKGFVEHAGVALARVPELVESSLDLSSPLATISDMRLEHNITLFAEWARSADVVLAPHVKTTMAPHIIARQLQAGAWAVTVATVAQAEAVVELGARRILIANELADPSDVRRIVRWQSDHPDLDLYVYVDSVAGVDLLDAAYGAAGGRSTLKVLLEVGAEQGRGGVRTVAEGVAVVARARATSALTVSGCSGFEGVLGGHRSDETETRVEEFLDTLLEVAAATYRVSDEHWVVSAGGSLFPDLVAASLTSQDRYDFPRLVVVRSGGYVTSDEGYLGVESPTLLGQRFEDALHVRARVLSMPEEGLALLGAGKRDLGTDINLPRPQRIFTDGAWHPLSDHVITTVNDQHAYLRAGNPGSGLDPRLTVGCLVELGISHPCTTFDRWRYLALVDTNDRLVAVYPTEF